MAFSGISKNPFPAIAGGAAVIAVLDGALSDVVGILTGNDKFRKLHEQKESDFKQYSEQAFDRRKWHTIQSDRTRKDYFFLLKYQGKTIEVPFNINPQRETITEPHAVSIQHTQGGGKLIHSDGATSKDITIQGTCGLYPGERRVRLPDSGIGSGMEGFKFLQNVFRRYCFLRRYGDLAQGLQLIYVNRRRQEAWVVDPKSFTSEDAVEHNFHFNYTIVLEALYPYDGDDAKGLVERIFDSIPGWRILDGAIQRFSEAVDTVNAVAGQISAIVDGFGAIVFERVVSLANTYADIKGNRLPNVANLKRDSVQQTAFLVREAAAALEAAGATDLAASVARLERNIYTLLLQDDLYEPRPDTQATSVDEISSGNQESYTASDGSAVDPSDAQEAGAPDQRPDASTTLGGDATEPASVPGTETGQADSVADSDLNLDTISSVGGSALDPNGKFQVTRFTSSADLSTAVPPSTKSITSRANWEQTWREHLSNISPLNSDYRSAVIRYGDSIQTLAFRLLGDHGRWPELVLLNNLRYPYVADPAYITANNLTNVLPWGGTILYPVQKSISVPRVRVWRNETFQSIALSPFERALGNDILIDETTGDAKWHGNDLQLVYGVKNLSQFMRKRIVTKKGTLRRSPRVGFSDVLGVSAGVEEAVIRAEAKSLFFNDDRIADAEVAEVGQDGQALNVSVVASVRNAQDPLIVKATL